MSAEPAPQEGKSTEFLRFAGEIDLTTAGQVTAEADDVDLEGVGRLVLDLRDVRFLDLAALRAVFGVRDRCEGCGVGLTVIAPRGSARLLFVLTGADEELDLADAAFRALP